ncbi:MAG: tetratricopeptide repeat protein, partial [Planctomycetota bacterium]|nr:tetratricopeptide repeat protein [Planctomycetota bacterium]
RELNSELVGLSLGHGRNTSGNVAYGGLGGLRALLKKHATDFFGRPKDPMPAWCIADVQRQAPDGVLDLKGVKGAPGIFRVYLGRFGRTKSGLAYFNRAVTRDPLFVPGYLGKAFAYSNEDSFEQAVIELRKASIIDPVNKWKYFLQIGDLYAREGQMEEALAFWDRVSQRVFTDATVFFQLGTRYFRAEQIDKTVVMLKKAIRINPDIAAYHMTLGNVYDYLQRYDDAVTEFRKALETSSQGMLLSVRERLSEIQLAWAYELFDRKDYAGALKQFEEIRAFQEVMESHYRKNSDEFALKRLSPESADVQVQLARCNEFLG